MSLRIVLLGCGILCATTVAACRHTKIHESLATPTATRGTPERFTFDELPLCGARPKRCQAGALGGARGTSCAKPGQGIGPVR